MSISSSAVRELRLLTEAEIDQVAGGPNQFEVHVNSLVGPPSGRTYMSPDNRWVASNGMLFFDSDGNGLYDTAWRPDGHGGWTSTADGDTWQPDPDNPFDHLEAYIEHWYQVHNVDGG